jgi:hypothetical protein
MLLKRPAITPKKMAKISPKLKGTSLSKITKAPAVRPAIILGKRRLLWDFKTETNSAKKTMGMAMAMGKFWGRKVPKAYPQIPIVCQPSQVGKAAPR